MTTPSWDWGQVLNFATGGNTGTQQIIVASKNDRIGGAVQAYRSGYGQSLWTNDGQQPSAGVKPGGTARNPTNATAGAVGQVDPAAANKLYLFGLDYMSKARVTMGLADRLADISGLSGTVTTAQNTTSLAVTRYTGAESAGNEIWIEIYTQIGATPTTITASYTNQAGVAGQTTVAATFGGTDFREVSRFIKLPFQSGDTGVRSVESVTVLASTGTAGDFGVTIIRPISVGGISIFGVIKSQSYVPGPIEIKTGAALFMYVLGSASTAAPFWQTVRLAFIEGIPS